MLKDIKLNNSSNPIYLRYSLSNLIIGLSEQRVNYNVADKCIETTYLNTTDQSPNRFQLKISNKTALLISSLTDAARSKYLNSSFICKTTFVN